MTNDRSSKVFDGGVEGHARMDACGLSDDSLRGGANSSNERGGAGIKPGPSDPSPGPDVSLSAPIADSSEDADIKAFCELVRRKIVKSSRGVERGFGDRVEVSQRIAAKIVAALSAPVGEPGRLPDRETFWLIERTGHGQWIQDHSTGHFFNLTSDVWHARRFDTERAAHERWRNLTADDRRCYKPTEHIFIHRTDDTHPPAPAVGPDVREALEAIVERAGDFGPSPRQLSAQDLVDKIAELRTLALSALTRPLGGVVQGETPLRRQESSGAVASIPSRADELLRAIWDDIEFAAVEAPTSDYKPKDLREETFARLADFLFGQIPTSLSASFRAKWIERKESELSAVAEMDTRESSESPPPAGFTDPT